MQRFAFIWCDMLRFALFVLQNALYFCIMAEQTKSYTLQELANEYCVNVRTMYSWLLPIRQQLIEMNPAKKRLKLLIPKQVKFIREFLG